jgi:NAD-dependent dihydropyrimidine dehydrogenase PreA subunit
MFFDGSGPAFSPVFSVDSLRRYWDNPRVAVWRRAIRRAQNPLGGDLMPAVIDPEKCTKCQECVEVCPVECITGAEDTVPTIDAEECTECAACESECPAEAITME